MTDDLERYLAIHRAAGTDPKPSVVKILAGEATPAKPAVEPGFKPATIDSRPERTTQQFLEDENLAEHQRRAKIEADVYLNAPAFDREAYDEKQRREFGRFQLGAGPGSSTNIDGSRR